MTSARQYLNSTEALPAEVILEDVDALQQLLYLAGDAGRLVESDFDRNSGYYTALTLFHDPSGEVEFRLSREALESLGIEWSED